MKKYLFFILFFFSVSFALQAQTNPKAYIVANNENTQKLINGETILFESIIASDGISYNSELGIFQVPYDGYYQILFSPEVSSEFRLKGSFDLIIDHAFITSSLGNINKILKLKAGSTILFKLTTMLPFFNLNKAFVFIQFNGTPS